MPQPWLCGAVHVQSRPPIIQYMEITKKKVVKKIKPQNFSMSETAHIYKPFAWHHALWHHACNVLL